MRNRFCNIVLFCGLVFSIYSTNPLCAKDFKVELSEVNSCLKHAKAGDRILIKDGRYADMNLKWKATGTEQKPIVIKAENHGGVVLTGESSLRLSGEYLTVDGLQFVDGYAPKGAVVEFRNGKDVANFCRLTECVIDNYSPSARDMAYSYVLLYGRHNRVDHCSFTGKYNLGVTLIVMLNEERSQENHHRIDHNYFGLRPVYGSNGAETIRVGTSQQALSSSRTIIEENVFERCNGEVEVVSIKSSDNIIRNNLFIDCEGVLALRHGDRNIVNGNCFFGHNRRNTGGIRVVNSGHKIYDNILVGVAGTRFFSALALMNGVPNSLPNRYCQVKDTELKRNLFIDCSNIEFGTGKDMERTLAPENVLFEGNTIINKKLSQPFIKVDETNGITFKNNRIQLASNSTPEGFAPLKGKQPVVPNMEAMRKGKGASYADNRVKSVAVSATDLERVIVHAGDDLPAIVASAPAGSVVELIDAGGDYVLEHAIMVNKPLTLRGRTSNASRPVIRFAGQSGENMITLADGAELTVQGISFSGVLTNGKALATAGISTAKQIGRPYTLTVDDCEFADFGESGFFAIKGTKSSFAPTITIRRCLFRNLSGDAINYAAELDDKGRYNADDMLIEDCAFYRLLGLPINIYRGGSDESTAGPYVTVRNCNFEDCCNKERGSVMRLIGPQVLTVEGCNFSNSGRGGAAIRLDEATWEKVCVRRCNFWNAGRILTMTGRVTDGEMLSVQPEYVDAARFDYRPKQSSRLFEARIGVSK